MSVESERDLNPSGGVRNLVGVHYQLLCSCLESFRILEISIQGTTPPLGASLVIEPAPGADLELRDRHEVDVVEIKSRASGRPWRLVEFIDDVLPTLYRSWETSRGDGREVRSAMFMTEGRLGIGFEFFDLFDPDLPPDPVRVLAGEPNSLDRLSHLRQRLREDGLPMDYGGLFLLICRLVRSDTHDADRRAVLHFLGSLEIQPNLSWESISQDLQTRIEKRIRFREDTPQTLDQLIGALLRAGARRGGTHHGMPIVPRILLKEVGLADRAIDDHPGLARRSRDSVLRELGVAGYDASLDVRYGRGSALAESLRSASLESPGTAISGEPRQGKTWALAALARELVDGGEVVVWAPSTALPNSRRGDEVARHFCQDVWGLDGSLNLARLRNRLAALGDVAPRVFALVDDVTSRDELIDLLRTDRCFIPIVTVPKDLATDGLDLHRLEVSNFSLAEFDDYLERHQLAGTEQVPRDDSSPFLRPGLAQLLVTALRRGSLGTTEAEIFSDYCHTVRTFTLSKLASFLYDLPPDTQYPFSGRQLGGAGQLNSDEVTELEQAGILSRSTGRWQVAEPLLVPWLVGRGLVEARAGGEIGSESFFETVDGYLNGSPSRLWGIPAWTAALHAGWWILEIMPEGTEELLAFLARSHRLWQPDVLCSSFGERAKTLALRRLEVEPDDIVAWKVLERMGGEDSEERAAVAIESRRPTEALWGACVLTRHAPPRLLDRMWDRLCSVRTQGERSLTFENRLEEAIVRTTSKDLDWLSVRLREESDPDRLQLLVMVLSRQSREAGTPIWHSLRGYLQGQISRSGAWTIAQCFEQFDDRTGEAWLRQMAGEPSRTGARSLRALARLDLDVPEIQLGDEWFQLFIERGSWLLSSLVRGKLDLDGFVQSHLAAGMEPSKLCVSLLSGFEHHLEASTVRTVIGALGRQLRQRENRRPATGNAVVHATVSFLDRLVAMEHLAVLTGYRDSALSRDLARVLLREGPNNTRAAHPTQEAAIRVLARIGGPSAGQAAEHFLGQAETWWAQREAIDLLLSSPTETGIELLVRIAHAQAETDEPLLGQSSAIEGLALLERTEATLRAVERWGPRLLRRTVDGLRGFGEDSRLADEIGRRLLGDDRQPGSGMAFGLAAGPRAASLLAEALRSRDLGERDAMDLLVGLSLSGAWSPEAEQACLLHVRAEYPGSQRLSLTCLSRPDLSETALDVLEELALEIPRAGPSGWTEATILSTLVANGRSIALATGLARATLQAAPWDDRWQYGSQLLDSSFLEATDIERLERRAISDPHPILRNTDQLSMVALLRSDPDRALRIVPRKIKSEPEAWLSWIGPVLESDFEGGLEVVEHLLSSPRVSAYELALLGERLSEADFSEVLGEFSRATNAMVRYGTVLAASGLLRLDEPSREALQRLLDDSCWAVRGEAEICMNDLSKNEAAVDCAERSAERADLRISSILNVLSNQAPTGLQCRWTSLPWLQALSGSASVLILQRIQDRLENRRRRYVSDLRRKEREDSLE